MITILLIISMAVLAIEIAYESSLSQDVKKSLRLDETPQIIEVMSKLAFWNRALSKYLFPLNLTFSILASIYKKFIELLNCPYCLSFHLTLWVSYLYLNGDVFSSILYGLITIPITHLIEKYVYD
jgi:hypothetical protein